VVNLVSIADSLEIVLGEAKTTNDCDIVASYADVPNSFELGKNNLKSNGTTAVTVAAAPVGGVQRQVKEITLFNNDTVTHLVTLRLNNAGTFYIIKQQSIGVGGQFIYAPNLVQSSGGTVTEIDTAGAIAGGPILNSGTISLNTQSNQLTQSGGTLAIITGPTIAAVPSTSPVFINTGTAAITVTNTQGALVIQNDGTAQARFVMIGYAGAGTMRFYAASGTFTTPTAPSSGSTVGGFQAFAYDGTVFSANYGAGIFFQTDGVWSTTSHPTRVIIQGTPTGATTTTEWVRITQSRVLFGNPPAADNGVDQLQVAGSALFSSGIEGTTTNNNAAAAIVGEVLSTTVTSGAAVTMTTATVTNVTSVSLTAGDWEVYGATHFTGNVATTVTLIQASITTSTGTLNTAPGSFDTEYLAGATTATLGADTSLDGMHVRASLTTSTTYFLTAKPTFAVNSLSAYGVIYARRAR
jgi:hypothetical protein